MAARHLRECEREVLSRIGAASGICCFLDYDGTLAPLAPTPAEAVPLPGTAWLLEQLALWDNVHIAVITGRPITDIRRLLDVPNIHYVGIHGLEVGPPAGKIQITEGVAVIRAILPAIKREMQRTLGHRPGILIEDKGATVACHYRLASPEDAELTRRTLAGLVRAYRRRGAPITLTYGQEVAEIRPARVNKGKTACALLAGFDAVLPIYIGDDQMDEDAFKLLPPHSLTIRVAPGPEPTAARYWVAGPDEVHRFLRAMLDWRLGDTRSSAWL